MSQLPQKKSMEELHRLGTEEAFLAHKLPIIVFLDNVRSMANVGSVFRTCDAFGIEQIILAGISPRPPHRDIYKTALGAEESVPWVACDEEIEFINRKKSEGYKVIGLEQVHGSVILSDFVWDRRPLLLTLGNEVDGIQDSLLSLCDQFLEIRQVGSKHSLNVSVAAGIALHSIIYRQ
jgi:23S rRNA (guanosine2251-2'-O)-methyltransferase